MKFKRIAGIILSAALVASCLNTGFAAEIETDPDEEIVIEADGSADDDGEASDDNSGSGTDPGAYATGSGELDGYVGPELGEVEYQAADGEEEVVTVSADADITPYAVGVGLVSTDSISTVGSSEIVSYEENNSVTLDGLSGLGTEDEPYLIYTEEELTEIAAETITNASSAYYQLQNNITITTETWNPIGSISGFTGVFDGNGYTITGSTTFESTGMSGLFATNSGTIKNLNVNLTISETATIAGLLVGVNSGSVSGCTSTGTIASTSSVYVGGLVGQNSGTISGCSSTAEVSSAGSAGGLVGYSTGLIQSCNATGTVTSTGSHAGGLVGYLSTSGAVTGSYATGNVTASEYAGGLIGYSYHSADSGSVTSTTTSYATGTVSGSYAGGLIGYLYTNHTSSDNSLTNTVKYSYAQGTVTGSTYAGGLIGYARADRNNGYCTYSEIDILYCYAIGVVNEGSGGGLAGNINSRDYVYVRYCYYNQANEGNKVGYSTSLSRLKTSALYYGWDFDNYWSISSASVYPYLNISGTSSSVEISGGGTASNPYIIENEDQLIAIVNGSLSRTAAYKLGNDIAVTARHWTPIGGNGTTNFTGTFDGDGYTISGLKLSNSYYENIGFFGYNEGTIKNLNLSVSFEGVYRAGGLAAYNTGTIENCTVSGTVTNVDSDGSYSGGLIGSNSGGTVTNCSSSAAVTAEYGSAGGLTGYNSGAVSDSYSTSAVTSTDGNAGGLVGYNNAGTVEASYASGSVTAGNYAGGLIGYSYYSAASGNFTSTTTSYATGTISGKYAGGLIGYLCIYHNGSYALTSTVKYSYAQGTVTGTDYAGGLMGYVKSDEYYSSYPEINILYCYASGLVNSGNGSGLIGGISSRNYVYVRYCYYLRSNSGNKIGFNVTASNLKKAATYYGWDFDNIWNISTSSVYPYIDIRGTYPGIEIEGFGDDDDPYIIENEEQLIAIVNGEIGPATKAYYELANDITVTASHWTPIGGNGTSDFNGVFDGAGYTISGIKLTNSHYGNIGFFGSNTGTIKNLNLSVTFEGVYNVGGLAGWNSGTIENCTVTGTITNVDDDGNASGGLIGVSNSGTITDCSSQATVTAEYGTAGGLVGDNYAGTITDSYASGSVTSTNSHAGGLVGTNESTGTIESSYATGNVAGYNYAGGLVGYNSYSASSGNLVSITTSYATGTVSGKYAGGLTGYIRVYHNGSYALTDTVSYSYAQGAVTGSTYYGGLIGYIESTEYYCDYPEIYVLYCYASGAVNSGSGAGLIGGISSRSYIFDRYCYYNLTNTGNKIGLGHTTAALMSADSYYGWNFENIWGIDGSYPYINLRGTYYGIDIEGCGDDDDPYIIEDETQLIAIVNGEIGPDFKAYYELANDIAITADLWTPIGGNGTSAFNGEFNGAGHTISGVKLSNSHYADIGFFGSNEGTIKNLNLEVTFEGVYNAGGIAGQNSGTIENCTVKGTITNVDSGGNYSGGIAGYNTGTITESSSSATVTAAYGSAGGITGYNSGTISYSNASSPVTASSSNSNAGGAVGYNTGSGIVENTYATGNVTAENYAGGLIGYSYYATSSGNLISTEESYATGTVSGKYAGGLIGYLSTYHSGSSDSVTNTVRYSYAKGTVSGTTYAGGLIGYIKSSEYYTSYPYIYVINCYSVGAVTASNAGGLIGGLSSTEYCLVQSSYYNADTSNCSDIDKGSSVSDASMKLQASYSGWDFDTVWGISSSVNDGYPYLQALGADTTGSGGDDETTTEETTTTTTTSSSGDDDDNTTTTETTTVDDTVSQLKVSAPENAKLGNTLEVKLIIRNVDVISGGQFVLNYDNTKVSLESDAYSAGAVLADNDITPVVNVDNDAGTCAVAFISNPTANFDAEGTLMTFTFTAIADGTAEFNVSDLSFSYKSGTKYIELDIAAVSNSTNITSYVLGDVNDDNKINYLDAVLILRSAVGMVTLDETQQLAADVDVNGSVNYLDAMYILDYSVGNISSFSDL